MKETQMQEENNNDVLVWNIFIMLKVLKVSVH